MQQALHPYDEMASLHGAADDIRHDKLRLGTPGVSRAVAARRDGVTRTATQGGVLGGFEARPLEAVTTRM